ncbi:MAG: hypothetical protein ABTQ28_11855, partial [Thauera sp.]
PHLSVVQFFKEPPLRSSRRLQFNPAFPSHSGFAVAPPPKEMRIISMPERTSTIIFIKITTDRTPNAFCIPGDPATNWRTWNYLTAEAGMLDEKLQHYKIKNALP